jgi:hypothetical protein
MRAPLILVCLALAACSASVLTPDERDEQTVAADALTGGIPVGSKLVATGNVNLRSRASTSSTILDVVPKGESVTALSSTPSSGFYKVSFDGQTGYCHGNYLKAVPSPPAAPPSDGAPLPGDGSTSSNGPSAASILAALGSCSPISAGKLRNDEDGAATVSVCGGPGDVVWWKADLDVDCDGKKSAVCNSSTDGSFQSQTAAVDSTGAYLDAATLPYVVVPLPSSKFDYKAAGIRLGSVVAVIYGDKVEYGIVGDLGPSSAIGEASYAMAKRLGINPDPSIGGVDSGVTYVAFTGTASMVKKKESHAEAVSIGTARADALVEP